jgi:hypothetical protein
MRGQLCIPRNKTNDNNVLCVQILLASDHVDILHEMQFILIIISYIFILIHFICIIMDLKLSN